MEKGESLVPSAQGVIVRAVVDRLALPHSGPLPARRPGDCADAVEEAAVRGGERSHLCRDRPRVVAPGGRPRGCLATNRRTVSDLGRPLGSIPTTRPSDQKRYVSIDEHD